MTVYEMKKNDFKKIRKRDWSEDIGRFDSLVIIPTRRMHDSGYLCMEFVAVDGNNEPICRMGGGSDVIHIGGIINETKGWSIDLLPCGYFRLFNVLLGRNSFYAGLDTSSFEIFAIEKGR